VSTHQDFFKMSSESGNSTITKCKPFYLNLILLNKEEVVTNKVAEKTGLKAGGFLGKAASFAANKLVSDDKVLDKLSEGLIEGVQKAITELNITASIESKFQHDSYVVIRVQVADFDTMSLVLAAKGPEFASSFSTLMVAVDQLGMGASVTEKVDAKIVSMINEGMMRKFSEMIPLKLSEKGLNVAVTTCSLEEQADFFFETYARLTTGAK
jgi:hypothetical protein